MKPGKRFGLSAEQKIDVWRRWKAGQTLHEIGRAFVKEHSSIRCLVSRHGGIAPDVRRRSHGGWLPVRRSVRLPNGHGCEILLLQSAKSLAARFERKHKRALTTILPEERRPDRLFPVGSEQSSAALKSTPTTNFGFSDSCE